MPYNDSLLFSLDADVQPFNDNDSVDKITDSVAGFIGSAIAPTAQGILRAAQINGYKSIGFTNDAYLFDNPTFGDVTIFMVVKSTGTNSGYVLGTGSDSDSIIKNFAAGKWEWFASPRTVLADTTGVWQIVKCNVANFAGAIRLGNQPATTGGFSEFEFTKIDVFSRLTAAQETEKYNALNFKYFNAAVPGDTTVPTVSSFTATANSATQITIAYTATDNVAVTGVDLDFSLDGTTNWQSLLNNSSAASPFVHTARSPSTQYFYRFRARDAAGNVSGYSTANATTQAAGGNNPPTVSAGVDQTITFPATATLNGTANDDGFGGSTLTTTWSKVSGAGTVSFANANALNTTATFGAAGVYVLRLTASDGSLSAAHDVQITVNAAAGDTTPPTVSMTSPNDGATVSGSVTISATASDNVGVAGVTFLVDGVIVGTDNSAPYGYSLNTTTLTDGVHSITARAADAAGNQANASIDIQVDNSSAPASKIIQLDWDAPDPSVPTPALPFAYRLMRSTSADFVQNATTITLGNVLTHPDTVAANQAGYYYKIQSQNAGGWSVFSAPIYVPLV